MDRELAQAIFAPRRIAIVGASADPNKTSYRPLSYLLRGGFTGEVFPVNPTTREILGRKTWKSIGDLPEGIDLAYILLPTEGVIDTVAECGAKGVRTCIVLSSGFSEAGQNGIEREARLAKTAREAGVRLIGPSSIGLINLHERVILTGNAAFAEGGQSPGGVFCASQSGSMIGALLSRGNAEGIGFAGFVSVGSEADLGLGALCLATLEDPRISSYMLFLETLRQAPALRRFAVEAAKQGRPVVALKLGRSSAAAELAVSHTGALAGEDDVADAFLADCGIARVETLTALLETGPLLQRLPPRGPGARARTVGILTTTGGGAALVVDQLGVRGVHVERPDDKTLTALRAAGANVETTRIVDLTLAGARYPVMKGALEAMLASENCDLVLVVVGSSARYQPDLAVKPIIDVAGSDGRVAVFLAPEAPEALTMLRQNGVPCFRTPESCADGIAAALRRRRARSLDLPGQPAGRGRPVDEDAGYRLLDELGIEHPASVVIRASGEAVDQSLYPAAVKVLHPDITHKTDVGGVVLGVRSNEELHEAIARIVRSLAEKASGVAVSQVLVQKMVSDAVGEALVGFRVDPQVGPIVMLAAGGIHTEIYRDRSVRMAPVDLYLAMQMIDEVRGLQVLKGFRGRPKGDIGALARAVVAVSRLALRPSNDVAELEINPLLVMPEGGGVRAVDVLAFTAASVPSRSGSI
jgi:acyl-CoA synthetase (NDP forming)